MKVSIWIFIVAICATLTSCIEEDPGPKQNDTRSYALTGFDKLEIGDAFIVTVQKGNEFSIHAEGDRRNLDDLNIFQSGSTLIARYTTSRHRQYNTYVTITMPALARFNFSGAVNSKVYDFVNDRMDITLSGASIAQMDIETKEVYFNISGASQLRLTGRGQKIDGVISGASLLSAFDYPLSDARLIVSGASTGRVSVSQLLSADVSGASVVVYRGSPQVDANVSGSSVMRQD
jgi:Protein of unknown function (DUF2807).